jgi:4-hydroxy-3-methylbut-2-enyl diphosphate reductase
MVERVLLASPRGYCAGVERAVETVERALEHYGAPVYVRKQIVHNIHVVRDLEARGAIFVEEETEVPEGATVVYSAHGVAPSVYANSSQLAHNVIDAVCPLVTKVHVQARRYADEGYTIVLIGHEGHEEVVGTMGEAPDSTLLVQTIEEVDALDLPPDAKLAYVTQTTLSVDETGEIITALRRRFPQIRAPRKEDICYATSNRQWAVKEMLPEIDLLLVIGSRNSSNSNRLVETARAAGTQAYLIDDESEIDEAWLDGARAVGITSGASAPEKLVGRVCDWFRARGVTDIEPYRIVEEDVTFRLPVELRRELELAAQSYPRKSRTAGGARKPTSLAASSSALRLDEHDLGPAGLDLDGERFTGDPLAVLEQAGVGFRDCQPDPVRELESQLLPLAVHGVDEVVDPAAQEQVVVEVQIQGDGDTVERGNGPAVPPVPLDEDLLA